MDREERYLEGARERKRVREEVGVGGDRENEAMVTNKQKSHGTDDRIETQNDRGPRDFSIEADRLEQTR